MVKYFILVFTFLSCIEAPKELVPINLKDERDPIERPLITVSNLHRELYNIGDQNLHPSDLFEYLDMSINCKAPRFKKVNWIVDRLMKGCLNFFLLNDHRAYEAFQKMDKLIDHESAECYTVGFMQVYMMSSILNCSSITSIDIDWRILHAHYQFDSSLNPNSKRKIGQLKIGEVNRGMQSFCHKEDLRDCFVSIRADLKKRLYFQLSFLHEAVFYPNESKHLVLFVSNAIDDEYTNREQFLQLYSGLAKFFDRWNKTVWIIYHTGGHNTFAIYKMLMIDNEAQVYTVCRDDLRYAKSYGKWALKRYRNYFDFNKPLSAASCLN
jgi:hypothetical protein